MRGSRSRLPVTIAGTVHGGLENHNVQWGFVLFGDGTSATG
jgi:hypothetical protein